MRPFCDTIAGSLAADTVKLADLYTTIQYIPLVRWRVSTDGVQRAEFMNRWRSTLVGLVVSSARLLNLKLHLNEYIGKKRRDDNSASAANTLQSTPRLPLAASTRPRRLPPR